MPDQDRDKPELQAELEELRFRLEEAEETLRAISEGEVDAVVVSGPRGEQVYALSGSLQEHMHFLQTLLDAIPNPVYYKGVNRLFLGCNRAFADYSGLTKEEIVGKTAEDLYPPDLAATYTKSDQELLDRPGVLVFEVPTIAADGSRRQILAHKTTFANIDGAVGGILGVLLDITERKQGEEELRRAKDELEDRVAARTVELQLANELLTAQTHDLEQRHRETILLSQMSEFLQSCRTIEEAHKAVAKFLRQLFPADSGALFIFGASRRVLEAVAAWGEKPMGDAVIDSNDCWALRLGRMYLAPESTAHLRCPHVADDSRVSLCVPLMGQGEVLGMLHLLTDSPTAPQLEAKQQLALSVGDRVGLGLANLRLQETLRNLSVRDPLTGLFNRRYLEESLEREVSRARRQGAALGIIMLDLDHFKDFNDTFGHEAGDVLLRELGAFLQRYSRGSDVACRYGGEEFVLTLPQCFLEIACRRAEEMRQAVKTLQVHHGHRTLEAITMSFGVAAFPEHGDNPDAVLNAADAAMYRAKQEGRDRVVAAGGNSA